LPRAQRIRPKPQNPKTPKPQNPILHQTYEKSFLRLNPYHPRPGRTPDRKLAPQLPHLCTRTHRQEALKVPGEIIPPLDFNGGLPHDPGGASGHSGVQVFALAMSFEVFVLKRDPRALNVGGGENDAIS
jgi:hypothetical protein